MPARQFPACTASHSNLPGRARALMCHDRAASLASGISREVAFPARPQTDGSWPAASLRNRAASRPPLRSQDEDSGAAGADQMAVLETALYARRPGLQNPDQRGSRSSAFPRNTEFLSLPFPCTLNELRAKIGRAHV